MVNEQIIHLFKVRSHPIRIDSLVLLKKEPLSTGELSEHFDVSRYAVMKHRWVSKYWNSSPYPSFGVPNTLNYKMHLA